MIVKDIRIVREFYKRNIKRTSDNDRNPHFAGEEKKIDGKIQFGFFEMFNGQGEIENKLTTILNMAGDSQAIYEFMQNAVDADSQNFFLGKYGPENQPYLVVLNDGDYFTLPSVISILAIGASSKYRNPDNIGQFGVGFKLAHRLIGADNSIKELLEENKGPILFSWSNGELSELAEIEEVLCNNPECEGVGKDAISHSKVPWLFKIVATNFPCLMNDPVWDARGKSSDGLFTLQDFDALRGAAKLCLTKVKDAKNFRKGTLLVIPLHPNKVQHVIGNIPQGLEVAATIISRRANKPHDLRTQIESDELNPEYLHTEHWQLADAEIQADLRSEYFKNVELMFLYGNPFKRNPFKGKPQFYRYFPMSLEQHGFHFAIHSNALTLSSARTELQENDSNKFLCSKLIPLLEKQLKEYLKTNTLNFCALYCSILLSNRGEGNSDIWIQGRQWLEGALWLPLIEILQRNVPVKEGDGFRTVEDPTRVLIKNSSLPIENWYKRNVPDWFFWEEMNHSSVCFEAKNKLGLNSINILDVLHYTNSIPYLNEWLMQSSNHAIAFLNELNNAGLESSEKPYDKSIIWKNTSILKIWWFDENVYSAEELSKNELLKYNLINYGPLNQVKDRLRKVGILVSSHVLDSYDKIERSIRETSQRLLPYLFNYEELNKLLSGQFSNKGGLNAVDKTTIFSAIESAVRNSANTAARRIETMKQLSLFSNKRGEVKPLFQLTSLQDLPKMLTSWQIVENETLEVNLKDYLADTKEAMYEHIIKPCWDDIASQAEQSSEQRLNLFTFIKNSFTLKPTMGALISESIFFTETGERTKSFYHQSLLSLNEKDYLILEFF